ncbi:MAG: hypothetical protein OXI80_20045 [Caldilineaceae bacterium]|nr:hypothetical protein [Caldilineaceae bacterium]
MISFDARTTEIQIQAGHYQNAQLVTRLSRRQPPEDGIDVGGKTLLRKGSLAGGSAAAGV